MSFAGPSAHRCLCFGEEDGPNGSYYPCPPELCEADAILERAEAAEAEVQRYREGLREQGEPIMDERFRDRLLRHVLSNEEVGQLVDAIESRERRARAILADSQDGGGAKCNSPDGRDTQLGPPTMGDHEDEERRRMAYGEPDGGGAK